MGNELNKKYQYGWYGTCEKECVSKWFHNMEDREYIESVIRVSQDGRTFEKFTSYNPNSLNWVSKLESGETFDDYINSQFKYMDCGMGYLVVRNSDNFNKNPEIDGFTVAHYDGSSKGFIAVDGCPEPTPTPTPVQPSIQLNYLDINYDYEGENKDDVEVTIRIRLIDSNIWQYKLSNSQNIIEVNPVGGNYLREQKFVIGPGKHTITVEALVEGYNVVSDHPNGTDSREFEVLASTPTPTPVVLPTPTPTQTITPIVCDCIPGDYKVIGINSSNVISNNHTFVGFEIGSEVGLDYNGFTDGLSSLVMLFNGDSLAGRITFTQIQPIKNKLIYVTSNSGECFRGTFTDVSDPNNIVVNLEKEDLHPDCIKTPTPEPEDCCEGFTQTASTNENGEIEDVNMISVIADSASGKLCWNTLTEKGSDRIFDCPFEVSNWSQGGLQISTFGEITSENNLFRFETDSGICYEGRLENSDDGVNIFKRIR